MSETHVSIVLSDYRILAAEKVSLDVTAGVDTMPLLHYYVKQKLPLSLEALLNHGADPNIRLVGFFCCN